MNFFHFQVSVPACVTWLFGRWWGPMNPCRHTLTHATQRVQKSPNMPSSIRDCSGVNDSGGMYLDGLLLTLKSSNERNSCCLVFMSSVGSVWDAWGQSAAIGSFWIDWRPCASPILWFLVLIVSLQSLFFLKLLFAFSFTKLGRYIESGGSFVSCNKVVEPNTRREYIIHYIEQGPSPRGLWKDIDMTALDSWVLYRGFHFLPPWSLCTRFYFLFLGIKRVHIQ